jgi:hypothetical protein
MVMAVSGDDTAKRYGISVNKLFPVSQYRRGSIPAGDDQLFTDAGCFFTLPSRSDLLALPNGGDATCQTEGAFLRA